MAGSPVATSPGGNLQGICAKTQRDLADVRPGASGDRQEKKGTRLQAVSGHEKWGYRHV